MKLFQSTIALFLVFEELSPCLFKSQCWKSLSCFLGSQFWGFISFSVYCYYICFRCLIHIPRGLLATHTLFKANLRKQIIFLPASAAGSCILSFYISELWSLIPEGRKIWQLMREKEKKKDCYQIGVNSNNEIIYNSGYTDVIRDPKGTVHDSLRERG